MIFVAVGTQFPFDRLVRCVDEWTAAHHIPLQAQIANGDYLPKHGQWERFMTTEAFNQHLKQADLIVSHAGMGNIMTALEQQKPIIVMNRQSALGEHRNDHQSDGLEWMSALQGVYTARDCQALQNLLATMEQLTAPQNANTQSQARRDSLVRFIQQALA